MRASESACKRRRKRNGVHTMHCIVYMRDVYELPLFALLVGVKTASHDLVLSNSGGLPNTDRDRLCVALTLIVLRCCDAVLDFVATDSPSMSVSSIACGVYIVCRRNRDVAVLLLLPHGASRVSCFDAGVDVVCDISALSNCHVLLLHMISAVLLVFSHTSIACDCSTVPLTEPLLSGLFCNGTVSSSTIESISDGVNRVHRRFRLLSSSAVDSTGLTSVLVLVGVCIVIELRRVKRLCAVPGANVVVHSSAAFPEIAICSTFELMLSIACVGLVCSTSHSSTLLRLCSSRLFSNCFSNMERIVFFGFVDTVLASDRRTAVAGFDNRGVDDDRSAGGFFAVSGVLFVGLDGAEAHSSCFFNCSSSLDLGIFLCRFCINVSGCIYFWRCN